MSPLIEEIERLIYIEMLDFEEAYLTASEKFTISYRTYLQLKQVYEE